MNPAAARIRAGLAVLAVAILIGLFALRWTGIDGMLLRILAISGGLLVTMLFVTYRALLKLAEAAKNNPHPPRPEDDEDDR